MEKHQKFAFYHLARRNRQSRLQKDSKWLPFNMERSPKFKLLQTG